MKTIKIEEETHKKLKQVKAAIDEKTFSETLDWLMQNFNFEIWEGKIKSNDK